MNSKKRFFLRKLTKVFACLTVALATLFMFAACSNGNVKTVYETKYEIIRETIDIEDLYTLYLTENPGATLEDFLLSLGISYDATEYATDKAISSVVSVYSTFTYEYTYMTRPGRFETIAEDAIGAGAGVIYEISENDVYIITNCHVIYDYDSVSYFDIDNDGTRDANETHFAKNIDILIYGFENEENAIPAVIVGGDIANDIAVIKCEKDDFIGEIKEVQIASSTLKVGQSVIAIGNPLAEGIAVTGGLISKVSEQITMIALNAQTSVDTITLTVIRTDTTINSGNSGGGLFNLKGELVGITNAKIVSSGVENMGYAIPVSVVVEVVNGIISG